MFLWGKNIFLSANLMETIISFSDMGRKNILKAIYALKQILEKEIMSRQLVGLVKKQNSASPQSEKNV